MQVMLSGAALMDGVLLVISANHTVPQPQTREHLAALTALGVKNIVIVQNKVDLVSQEEAMENYRQIKEFIKGTIAENAPIIPMSAMHGVNLDALLSAIEEFIPTPERDETKPARMMVARSFDINRPGTTPKKLKGGVFGGSLLQGTFKVKDKVVVLPGLKKRVNKKLHFIPVKTTIKSINLGTVGSAKEAKPGGLLAIQTTVDPSMTRSDNLSGSIIASEGAEPPIIDSIEIKAHLFENVVGSEEQINVKPILQNEKLLLTIGTATTVGIVTNIKKKGIIAITLSPNVAIIPNQKIAISRNFSKRWRLIGWAEIVNYNEVEIEIVE